MQVNKAATREHYSKVDPDGKEATRTIPATYTIPEYYFLLPLTIPLDIATSPIQLIVLLSAPHIDG